MTLHSLLASRRRIVVGLSMLIIAGAILRNGFWPLYRNEVARLDASLRAKTAELDSTRRLVARTKRWKDSLPAWRERAMALRKSRIGGLDAIQRSGIRGLRAVADSAGVTTEAIVADQYSARSREACRREPCLRLATLRGTFIGDTESVLELVAALDDSTQHFSIRELLVQPQLNAGTMGAQSHLRVEATIGIAGLTSVQRAQ